MGKRFLVFVTTVALGVSFGLGVFSRPWVARFGHRCVNRVCRFFRATPSVAPLEEPLYPMLSKAQKARLDGAIKISFVGDLILLRDGVEFGHDATRGTFSFDDIFARVSRFWHSDDITLGVFEGPMAGEEKPWSTSDYYDCAQIPLYLNFPDAFGEAVARAGMDFVTLANNHLLDCGIEGARRTVDVLDRLGVSHIGAYRNQRERDAVKIITVRGKRLAVLAYTYGCNYWPESTFYSPETSSLTSPLAGIESPYLATCQRMVEADFARAKALSPDAIIVLPHMGEQFLHEPDETQRFWCDTFVRLGAALILSDHSHAVQPIEWKKRDTEDVLVVHCPGNFVNSYSPNDGDASMMVEIFLDPATAAPIAASCIPLYAYGVPSGNYVAIPTHDALHDTALWNAMSRNDQRRLREVQALVTKYALGTAIPLECAEERHLTFPGVGYVRQSVAPLVLTERQKASPLWKALIAADRICFVGDSITEGTRNGGYGWFEPLVEALPKGKVVTRFARGSTTTRWFEENTKALAEQHADLYVMAYGCNDIRYRDPNRCAMTPEDYIASIQRLVRDVRLSVPQARFVFVAPWRSRAFDPNWRGTEAEKNGLYASYAEALQSYCERERHIFVNHHNNNELNKIFYPSGGGLDLVDAIHPGSAKGIRRYSAACLESNP